MWLYVCKDIGYSVHGVGSARQSAATNWNRLRQKRLQCRHSLTCMLTRLATSGKIGRTLLKYRINSTRWTLTMELTMIQNWSWMRLPDLDPNCQMLFRNWSVWSSILRAWRRLCSSLRWRKLSVKYTFFSPFLASYFLLLLWQWSRNLSWWHMQLVLIKVRLVILFCNSALTLLAGRQEGHPACKKTEWWDAGVVICLGQGADLHMAQLIPLLLTVSCFSNFRLVLPLPAPRVVPNKIQRAVKWL